MTPVANLPPVSLTIEIGGASFNLDISIMCNIAGVLFFHLFSWKKYIPSACSKDLVLS